MNCERFDKLDLDLLYDELDELTLAAVQRHLAHCTRCQELYGQLRATRDLAQVPLVEPPTGLFERIVEDERRARRDLPFGARMGRAMSQLADYAMRPQLAMAALLLLMIGSGLVFVRAKPSYEDRVAVTELGAPRALPEVTNASARRARDPDDVLFDEERAERKRSEAGAREGEARTPVAPATYAEALAAYESGRYAEAEHAFSEVVAGGGEKAPAAALLEAHAARNGSGCQRAAGLYDAVASRYAGTTVADEAMWSAAGCYRMIGQTERARAHYQALLDRAAFTARAQASLDELGRASAVTAKETTAAKTADVGSNADVAPAASTNLAAAKSAAAAEPTTAAAAAPATKTAGAPAGAKPSSAAGETTTGK